jgi:hypothetical protein
VTSDVVDKDRTELARSDPRPGRAVARMLERADAAASRGDYVDALDWLSRVDVLGDGLDPVYESRRDVWRLRLEIGGRVGPSQWFG